jgi:hypothetical protein
VRPVRVVSVSGDVTGTSALTGRGGVTHADDDIRRPGSVVLVDYGQDVGGLPLVAAESGPGGQLLITPGRGRKCP